MNRLTQARFGWIVIIAMAWIWLLTPGRIDAQNLDAQLSTREGYVGQPIILQIQISNATKFEAPKIPDIAGLDIALAGTPGRSSRISIINGRRSESSSVTYVFQITPRRDGKFTIPPIEVDIDGGKQSTPEFRLVVGTSETGDLMFVEVTGQDEKVYVGQPVKLTLKIWIRPFTDPAMKIKLSEANMWQLLSRNTNWGAFQKRLEELAAANRRPSGEEVLREDGEGNSRAYYLYEVEAMVYPQRPGQIEIGDVQVVANYPTELGETQSRFSSAFADDAFGGSSLMDEFFRDSPFNRNSVTVKSARPIAAGAKLPPIKVIDVPTAGRPADYRGAVGKYRIATQAKPINVKAGDPLTLQIVLQGDGPMDLVQAPPISFLPNLTSDFKVADDTLAGFVQDDAKLFTTSIRPRRADVTQIPPISFSFFNPDTESFETAYSEPIAITVDKADLLSLDSIVGNANSNDRESSGEDTEPPVATPVAESRQPIVGNFSADEVLHADSQNNSPPWFAFAIAPVLCGLLVLFARRESLAKFGFAPSQPAARALAKVRQAHSPSELAAAIECVFPRPIPAPVEAVIARCNRAAFSPLKSDSLEQLRIAAAEIIREFAAAEKPERQNARTHVLARCWFVAVVFAIPLTANALALQSPVSTDRIDSQLSLDQQHTILAEANRLYEKAIEVKPTDTAEAKELLSKSIEKYKTVVASGLKSWKLFFNLGNAYLQRDDLGLAIASFEQAHRIAPHDQTIGNNLSFVRSKLESGETKSISSQGMWNSIGQSVARLNQRISAGWVWLIALISWSIIWVMIGVRLTIQRIRLTPLLAVSCLAFLFAAISLGVSDISKAAAADGIAITKTAELHQADSQSFPVTGKISVGQPVKLLDRRGNWLKVQPVDDADSGWVSAEQVYLFSHDGEKLPAQK